MNHKIWNTVPYEAKDLILKMLSRDIPRRLTAKEVLSHPFFKVLLSFTLFRNTPRLICSPLKYILPRQKLMI